MTSTISKRQTASAGSPALLGLTRPAARPRWRSGLSYGEASDGSYSGGSYSGGDTGTTGGGSYSGDTSGGSPAATESDARRLADWATAQAASRVRGEYAPPESVLTAFRSFFGQYALSTLRGTVTFGASVAELEQKASAVAGDTGAISNQLTRARSQADGATPSGSDSSYSGGDSYSGSDTGTTSGGSYGGSSSDDGSGGNSYSGGSDRVTDEEKVQWAQTAIQKAINRAGSVPQRYSERIHRVALSSITDYVRRGRSRASATQAATQAVIVEIRDIQKNRQKERSKESGSSYGGSSYSGSSDGGSSDGESGRWRGGNPGGGGSGGSGSSSGGNDSSGGTDTPRQGGGSGPTWGDTLRELGTGVKVVGVASLAYAAYRLTTAPPADTDQQPQP